MINGKMYKVLFPVEGTDGKATHWMRLGTAFTNKDESLNAYIDSLPLSVFGGKQLKLQIREMTEDDLRRKDHGGGTRRDSFAEPPPPMLGRQTSLDGDAPF